MKKLIFFLLIALISILVFDYFYIFSLFLSFDSSLHAKKIIQTELIKHSPHSLILSKKALDEMPYPILLPQYLKHDLKRKKVFFYVLKIEETNQHIPIEINHQFWYISNDASIVSSFSSVEKLNNEAALFSIFIHTKIDQMEAYRQYVQSFIFFLLNSENTMGPKIKSIRYDDQIGLSYLDYKHIHYILGKNPSLEQLPKLLEIMTSSSIVRQIKDQSYNEIDFRFEKRIICRFQSNNSFNNP